MFADKYLSNSKVFKRRIFSSVNPNLDAIVVIPCCNEDFLFDTLMSLDFSLKRSPSYNVEVIVVINSSENASLEIINNNKKLYDFLVPYISSSFFAFSLEVIFIDNIPEKIAGVGYARRVAMDEAVCRFNDISKPDALIISLDADSLVSEDYFKNIFAFRKTNHKIASFVFAFSHNYDKNKYSEEEISACRLYERYLLYHKEGLKKAGFPHYFHTIGSCFAFTAYSYIKAGAMPCRQAGEDFYFLHKLANSSKLAEIDNVVVFPAPRISNRVPFGTGKAVISIIENKYLDVYNHKLYEILKNFFALFISFYDNKSVDFDLIPKYIIDFVGLEEIKSVFDDCFNNSSNFKTFEKRLFVHFNAFWIIKFFNSFKYSSDFPPERWLLVDNKN